MSKIENKTTKNEPNKDDNKMPFGRDNYLWVLIGIAFIFIGFILMIGGGSNNPDVFNEAIFSFRRITLAPILVLAGFGIEIYAIMKKNKNKDE